MVHKGVLCGRGRNDTARDFRLSRRSRSARRNLTSSQPVHWVFSLRAFAASEMPCERKLWRCYVAEGPVIHADRSEDQTSNSQVAGTAAFCQGSSRLCRKCSHPQRRLFGDAADLTEPVILQCRSSRISSHPFAAVLCYNRDADKVHLQGWGLNGRS